MPPLRAIALMSNLPPDYNDDGKYTIDSKIEIVAILRELMKTGELVTAYFNAGREFVVTAVLQVDSDRNFALLDSGANPEINKRLLASGQINATSSQNGVRVQFKAGPVASVTFDGRPVFRVPLPASLIKLQRRQFYRMATPLMHPVRCEVPVAEGTNVHVLVADISVGGLCLIGEPPGVPLVLGQSLLGCRVILPDMGTLTTDLMVRNVYSVTLKNGTSSRRTGCQFVRLGSQQEAMIQRYIMKLDRERRAK